MSAAVGAGIQESVLRANQVSRDPNQMAMSIGSSILMGGLLGGLTHGLTKAHLDKMSDDMVHAHGAEAISPPTPYYAGFKTQEYIPSGVWKLSGCQE